MGDDEIQKNCKRTKICAKKRDGTGYGQRTLGSRPSRASYLCALLFCFVFFLFLQSGWEPGTGQATNPLKNFKSGLRTLTLLMIMLFLHSVTQAYSVKKFSFLPTGVEPMTSRFPVRMLYHQTTGDLLWLTIIHARASVGSAMLGSQSSLQSSRSQQARVETHLAPNIVILLIVFCKYTEEDDLILDLTWKCITQCPKFW